MSSPTGFTPIALMVYIAFIIMQIAAVTMLPKTAGFTKPVPTVTVLALFLVSIAMLAKLVHQGLPLGVVFPISSAVIPLIIIVLGIVFYKESHSWPKLALLSTACVMVGVAAAIS